MSLPSPSTQPRPRLLVLEFWGLGDLTFATTFLRLAVEYWDVTLAGKAHARALLEPTFSKIEYRMYDPPWTAFRHKYRFWNWDWRALVGFLRELRERKFDAAVSVRNDPRDHLLMWLAGAKARYGFPRKGSGVLLTHPVARTAPKQHKVEDWRDLAVAFGLAGGPQSEPGLDHARYRSRRVDELFAGIDKPIVCFHPGARIKVRRWPEAYFAHVIRKMREHFEFHLALVPDLDGYGQSLSGMADSVVPALSVGELVDVLGRVDLLLCNDSGPTHIAASCGRPALPIFGPTDPDWFRPWGVLQKVIIRDICPLRPCFDYCPFSEPYCLTNLSPEDAWPEIRDHVLSLVQRGVLPERLLRKKATAAER